MAATVHLRLQTHPRLAPDVERTDALGTVGLVRRETHQVHLELGEIDLYLAGGLRCIDVKDHTLFAADLADLCNRLHHSDFVIHKHHRHHDGVRTDRRLQHLEVDQAVFLDVEISGFEALAFEFAHGVEHRLVLGLQRDQVLALALIEVGCALDGEVVRFGCTRRPDDFLGISVDQCRDLLARVLDRLLGIPAVGMRAAGRVAEMLGQPRNHFCSHTRVHRRGRRIVEVNRELQHCVSPQRGVVSF